MPILPGNKNFITSEETQFEAPASENTMQRIGEAVNYLNGFAHGSFQTQTITASGTFVVPAGVTKLMVTGCGCGGNGAGTPSSSGGFSGQGGDGAPIVTYFVNVTPSQSISVTIGTTSGSNSAFGSLTFIGGRGGSALVNRGNSGERGGNSFGVGGLGGAFDSNGGAAAANSGAGGGGAGATPSMLGGSSRVGGAGGSGKIIVSWEVV